ncbi:MAG TPA: glycosyltransferase [Pontiella sp.]
MNAKPQILVCQRGARHRYSVPRILHEEDMLAALYTDSSAISPLGRAAVLLEKSGLAGGQVRSLASRNPEGIPIEKVYSSDRLIWRGQVQRTGRYNLSPIYQRWGLKNADLVYSMYGEEIGFLQWAKKQGVRIAVDIFVHPSTHSIVRDESLRMGRYGVCEVPLNKALERHIHKTFDLADVLLCPSEWVADGVVKIMPECRNRIRIVPYGASINQESENQSPQWGRVFFAGRDVLRKGLHYLADAAALLRADGHPIEVRAAGVEQHEVEWIEHRSEIQCLGNLSKEQMREEFCCADLFVLPSLSEGQAGVLLEAMACGCPVVATRESGVDFNEGCGIAVPARSAGCLAAAIREVVGNRSHRERLAQGALKQSEEFSIEQWKKRLVSALCEAVKS